MINDEKKNKKIKREVEFAPMDRRFRFAKCAGKKNLQKAPVKKEVESAFIDRRFRFAKLRRKKGIL